MIRSDAKSGSQNNNNEVLSSNSPNAQVSALQDTLVDKIKNMHDKRMGNLVKKFGPSKSQVRPAIQTRLEKSNEDLKNQLNEHPSEKTELIQVFSQ
jgi:hypothetical protein